MKIKITGNVLDAKGKITGIVDLNEKAAKRLVDLGKAVYVEAEEVVQKTIDAVAATAEKTVKSYKQMNCPEQTAFINSLTSIEELQALFDDTKSTIKPVLEERVKFLSAQNTGEQAGDVAEVAEQAGEE